MKKKNGEMIEDLIAIVWVFAVLFLTFVGFICGPLFSVASFSYNVAVFSLALVTIVLLQLNRKCKISSNWVIFASGLLMILLVWGPFLYF